MEPKQKKQQSKEDWIEHYASQMLRLFSTWGTCLGVSRQYLLLLREQLADFYEHPLKKSFIEATYQSSTL